MGRQSQKRDERGHRPLVVSVLWSCGGAGVAQRQTIRLCRFFTEEEFYRALARFEKDGTPTIFVLFKHIDPGQMADPGPELEKVLAFRKKLEQTRTVLYRSFDNEKSFRLEIDKRLTAFGDGRCETMGSDRVVPIFPTRFRRKWRSTAQQRKAQSVEELEKLRAEAKHHKEEAEQARTTC